MVLDKLGDSLKNTLNKITSSIFVDEKLINELIKDIQRALLTSDVNVKLVFELTNKIKERTLKEDLPAGLTKKEHLLNVVYEELVNFLGGQGAKISIDKKPFKLMLVGLYGSGKTTTCGKLAKYFSKRAIRVAMIQLDTWRPAAFKQLKQLGDKINIPVFGDEKSKDPQEIYKKYAEELEKYDFIIVDTAGRDALSDELVVEIKKINALINPDETLLTLSGDIGQAAEKQAQGFHESCDVTGVIITKLDGTAKGGGALIACSVTDAPVKFIGVGEKIDDLEEFNPEGFVSRILGMGDLEVLLEKARGAISNEDAEDMGKRFLKGEFNLIDLYDQMQAMKKMGPLSKVMELIPGMGQIKMPKEAIDVQQEKIDAWKFVMDSMTKEELEDPTIISGNRVDRIHKGSGREIKEVRDLLKQYKQSKKMMKMFKGGSMKNMERMMKKMGGAGGMKGMPKF
ncbi:signal recognition particle protein [archaeon]|jgi:signal recognition particle subunit SRP54|nr:signal recognition particle protein [archaeon]MBT6821839.1 signal recognition particle protein [archaeon]MBT7392249.1 signal recognition particle protein [archaeon]